MRAWVFLLLLPLAGCLSDGADDPERPEPAFQVPEIPEVSAADLLADLHTFSKDYSERAANLPDHEGARVWLMEQFSALGLEVWRQNFTQGIDQANIVGIDWGVQRDQWVIVGGHYDMTTTAGADRPYSEGAYDDGSGTIMTVQLAKAFSLVDQYYTIAFVAFDGEERGLQGSGAFAEAMVAGEHPYGDVVMRGMLDLDMFGLNWPGIDAPIYFDQNSPELLAFVQEYTKELELPEDMIQYTGISLGRSDYAHFFRLGVPSGFFISDFEQWQAPGGRLPVVGGLVIPQGAYPFWHVQDTYETMEAMAGDAAALEAGFQMATDIAAGVVHFLSADPETVVTGIEA